ncbi:MAG TPA: hypothetical protein VN457_03070, partial [Chlamydiales bacterium]|nr:hypothetical protein [Chlamydiales bacterium]
MTAICASLRNLLCGERVKYPTDYETDTIVARGKTNSRKETQKSTAVQITVESTLPTQRDQKSTPQSHLQRGVEQIHGIFTSQQIAATLKATDMSDTHGQSSELVTVLEIVASPQQQQRKAIDRLRKKTDNQEKTVVRKCRRYICRELPELGPITTTFDAMVLRKNKEGKC